MMIGATVGIGLVLIAIGISAFFGTGGASATALIPAALGLALCALGGAGRRPHLWAHARHGVAAVALLGILGSTRGLPGAATLLTGGTIDRPAAVVAQAMTTVLCAMLIALYAATLVAARRRLAADVGEPGGDTPAQPLREVG